MSISKSTPQGFSSELVTTNPIKANLLPGQIPWRPIPTLPSSTDQLVENLQENLNKTIAANKIEQNSKDVYSQKPVPILGQD